MRRIRNKLKPLLFIGALLLPMAVLAEPAAAVTTAAGNATFNGVATLPKFPCPTSPATSCSGGRFDGTWTGHMQGTEGAGNNPFEVSWTTLNAGSVHADFVYEEASCLQGASALLGEATGSGLAQAGPGQTIGFWTSTTGSELPRAIIGVRLFFNFDWVRLGNSAVIIVKPGSSLQIDIAGLGWREVSNDEQDGAAIFVPTHSSNTVVPTCGSTLNDVEGLIAGDLTLTGRP